MRIAAGRGPFELGDGGVVTVMIGRIDVYDPGILHRRSLRTTTHTFTRVTKWSMVHVRHAPHGCVDKQRDMNISA
ncbi:MAG: hypothetical protein ABL952_06900 [Pyrinomonadaceae bacterium]